MTKQEFLSKHEEIKKHGTIRVWVWLAGMAVLMFLWSHFFHDRIRFYELEAHTTDPLFAICFLSYIFGGIALIVWLLIRHERRIGFICPHCGRRIWKPRAKSAMVTDKCGKCGMQIVA